MADAPTIDIHGKKLADHTPAELHERGIERLSQSLAAGPHNPESAHMLAVQGLALFIASLSADTIAAAAASAEHRAERANGG